MNGMLSRLQFFNLRVCAVPLMTLGLMGVLLSGCGGGAEGQSVTVQGKVLLNGQPLSDASIQLTSLKSGSSSMANLNADGTYAATIANARAGEVYGVSFGAPVEAAGAPVQLDAQGNPTSKPAPKIPAKFLEYTTSGLKVDIGDQATQTADFELKS